MSAADIVEQKVAEAKGHAETALATISNPGDHDTGMAADAVREIYRPLVPKGVSQWTNFSKDMRLVHQLLVSPPAIVDIAPLPEEAFGKLFGVSIADMTILAQQRAVIPNIYARNPDEWMRSGELSTPYIPLLTLSIANGQLTDSYLEAHQRDRDGRSYKAYVSDTRAIIYDTLRRQEGHRLRALASRIGFNIQVSAESDKAFVEGLATTAASNFGYIQSFGTAQIREELDQRLLSGRINDLAEALTLVRVGKSQFASPFTAALGGHYIWPAYAKDFGKLFRPFSHKRSPEAAQWQAQVEELREKRELLEFVYRRIAEAQAGMSPPRTREEALAALVSHDFRQRMQRIWALNEAIPRLICAGRSTDASLAELEALYKDLVVEANRVRKTTIKTMGLFGVVTEFADAFEAVANFPPLVSSALSVVAPLAAAAALFPGLIDSVWKRLPNDRSLFFGKVEDLKAMR